MRSLRLLVATALSASVLVVGSATPAQACTPPVPGDDGLGPVISDDGGTISVNVGAVITWANRQVAYVAAEAAYAECYARETADHYVAQINCILSSPGVANLQSPDPVQRYVEVNGGIVSAHYANALSDVAAIASCIDLGTQ